MSERLDSTVFRSEEWQQTGGEGILELRGGELEIVLFFNGTPLIYDAYDGGGSVGRFVALLSDGDRIEAANFIAQAAANGFADVAPLHQQIAPLLQLLPNGQYHLTLEQIPPGYNSPLPSDYDQGPNWKEGRFPATMWYYPESRQPVLLWTQSESSLEDDTINKYLDTIDRGERPALITVGAKDHDARFILDGHHKLYAYWCCGVSPYVLHIEFQRLAPISSELAQSILSCVPRTSKTYLELITG